MSSPYFDRGSGSVIEAMRDQIRMTPAPARRHWSPQPLAAEVFDRVSVLVGASVALATLAAALAFSLAGTASPPAFAVAARPNGKVTITLRQLAGVTGLNRKLAAMGLGIRAVPVFRGCHAPVRVVGSHGPAATLRARRLVAIGADGRQYLLGGQLRQLTVETHVPAGDTLVLAASASGLLSVGQMVRGPAPRCVGTATR